MKKFEEDERLPISSLKQFIYCKRRFALMYLNCDWGENYKIAEGDLLHKRVDDPYFNEKRRDIYTSRSVPVFSDSLNLYGVVDLLEFIKDENGIGLPHKKERWRINLVEYKNGKPEKSQADNFQLCAQAICLEEMFQTSIESGDIFYGKIRRRMTVELTDCLRSQVRMQVKKMQTLLNNQQIPVKDSEQNCSLCSLIDVCIPSAFSQHKKFKDQITLLMKGK
ncbi:MAG: CRISPR-associated exonuclease Cas4 [Eubacteriaceae bacterium]|jgi:CRISPR-associated exonuclease Cas4|nr:CRISPR-associated exonuclease Cas4 [Eubacteriaceae bacterium]